MDTVANPIGTKAIFLEFQIIYFEFLIEGFHRTSLLLVYKVTHGRFSLNILPQYQKKELIYVCAMEVSSDR